MARWNDTIELIKTTPPEKEKDEDGFANPLVEHSRSVFCNKRSVGSTEFYKSQQNGYEVTLKIDVHTFDYGGEKLAIFQGKTHKVLRAFERNNGEVTELTLSDKSERRKNSG